MSNCFFFVVIAVFFCWFGRDLAMIPKRLDTGTALLYFRVKKAPYYTYDFVTSIKLWFMVLEAFLYENPPTGLILIVDLEGVRCLFAMQNVMGLQKCCLVVLAVAFDAITRGTRKKFSFLPAGGLANQIATNTSLECCLFH